MIIRKKLLLFVLNKAQVTEFSAIQVAQIPHKEVHKNTNMSGFMKTV